MGPFGMPGPPGNNGSIGPPGLNGAKVRMLCGVCLVCSFLILHQ